jgi:hypothetical protein
MWEIIGLPVAVLGIAAFLCGVWGMLSPGPDYMPISPDEEYEWLTEKMGLSHEEAEEVMYGVPRTPG